jgi:hypothetical protein
MVEGRGCLCGPVMASQLPMLSRGAGRLEFRHLLREVVMHDHYPIRMILAAVTPLTLSLVCFAAPTKAEEGMGTWTQMASGRMAAEYGKDVPRGTVARVTNLKNGRSVQVRIDGRLPSSDPIIVLSADAGLELGMGQTGDKVPVRVDIEP